MVGGGGILSKTPSDSFWVVVLQKGGGWVYGIYLNV